MPVERIPALRSETPGDTLAAALEAIEEKGTITQIIPLFDEFVVLYTPKQKTRETRTEKLGQE